MNVLRMLLSLVPVFFWSVSFSARVNIDRPCPASCDCHMAITGGREITCFTDDIKEIDFGALWDVQNDISLNIMCSTGVPAELTSLMFGRMKNLRSISFQNCKISYIHRNAFAKLNQLQAITIISASNLHLQLHQSVFENVTSLKNLTLAGSGILKIPNICIVPNITYLNISANSLDSFSVSGISCENNVLLRHLNTIDISNNHLKTLSELQILGQSFPYIETLLAADNNIDLKTSDNPLNHFSRLRHLDLSNNNISKLPESLLLSSNSMEVLILSNNNLNEIPENIFEYCKKLLQIELQRNHLGDTVWSRLAHVLVVQSLNLSENKLTVLNQSTLNQLTQLVHLDVAKNFITNISARTFQNLQRLYTLNLANNRIERVEDESLYGLLYLTRLELQNNVIYSMHDDVLNAVTGLTQLNISTNILSRLPSIKKVPKLIVFDASNNQISNITEDYFAGQHMIQNINLAGNRISWLPDTLFGACRSLENLDLSNNYVKYFHPSLFLGLNIQILQLHGNKIESVGILFASMKHLKELNLNNNEIRDTIQSFTFPKSIVLLDLAYNKIEHIRPLAFSQLSDIKTINLRFNRISTLTNDSLAISTGKFAQTRFYIDENPLKCDCRLLWLKYWHQTTDGPMIVNFNETRCTGAYEYPEEIVAYVPKERFLCQYHYSCTETCKCCDFTACDCKYKCPEKCECFSSADHVSVHIIKCSNKSKTKIDEFIPRNAKFLDVSGNTISTIPSHSFIGLSQLEELLVNNSAVQHLSNGSFVGLANLRSLDLHDNFISSISRDTFLGMPKLQTLDLDNNKIAYIQDGAFSSMTGLVTLRLSNNLLLWMNDYLSSLMFTIKQPSLFSNSWQCDCILYFSARSHPKVFTNVADRYQSFADHIKCINGTNKNTALIEYSGICSVNNGNVVKPVSFEELQRNDEDVTDDLNLPVSKSKDIVKNDISSMNYREMLFIPIIIAVTIALIFVICIVCRREIVKFWLFTKYSKKQEAELLYDKTRHFDAFIAYHPQDESYVVKELAFKLEQGKTKHRLRLLHRDRVAGTSIINFIDKSVKASHRTILVLSSNFVNDTEVLKCVTRSVKNDSASRLIFVILGKFDKSKIDHVLMNALKRGKCVHHRDSFFWVKMCFYLPDPGKTDRNISCVETQPYASTDVSTLTSSSMTASQAYEEPFSITKRPLPKINEYVSTSQTYTGGSQQSSNIYEEIKENPECTSLKYDVPWTESDMELNQTNFSKLV